MPEQARLMRFEQALLPHLDAAYNLARWLVRNEHDAEDLTQEAYLRALTFFDSFHGGNARAWLLKIVRNTCYTFLSQTRKHELDTAFDEEIHGAGAGDPEAPAIRDADRRIVREALEELPPEFREIVVLRDLEDLSYKEIADVANLPIGTVMSRLARARRRLEQSITRMMATGVLK